jgi:VanZ family protein
MKTWSPVVVWALVIFGLSSIPGTRIPDVGFTFADKVAHVCVYGVLGALFYRGWRRSVSRLATGGLVALAALCALGYGVTDEIHQMFVPNRSSELLDLAADLVGGTLGAAAAVTVVRLRTGKRPTAGTGQHR